MEAEEDAPQQQRMAKVDTAQAPVLRLAFNTSKAGMDEPVKDSINAMVTRDMKNPYFQRQAEKRRNNQAKIDTYAAKI